MRRAAGLVSSLPIHLAAMCNAQEQHAQDVILDACHDAPAPPTRYRHSGAPRLRGSPSPPRRLRHFKAGKALRDAVRG